MNMFGCVVLFLKIFLNSPIFLVSMFCRLSRSGQFLTIVKKSAIFIIYTAKWVTFGKWIELLKFQHVHCMEGNYFWMSIQLKYGFHKKYFWKKWTSDQLNTFSPRFFQISTDLEKKTGGKKCSNGQRLIFLEVLLMKSIF